MSEENPEIGRIANEIAEASRQARRYRAKDFWTPYPKQAEFFATGKTHKERAFFAANQIGKSQSAAYEIALHACGEYPENWPGRKFNKPVSILVLGETQRLVRDVCQTKLFGKPGNKEEFGAGMVPKDRIDGDPVLGHGGEKDVYDHVRVKHASGGVSFVHFGTYQAGPQAVQGRTVDIVWLDEQPQDFRIYGEALARIVATNGFVMVTCTPLFLGELALRFLNEPLATRTYTMFGYRDLPPDAHIRPEDVPGILAGFPEHEREARGSGSPMMGEGRVYTAPEADIIEDAKPSRLADYIGVGDGRSILGCTIHIGAVL